MKCGEKTLVMFATLRNGFEVVVSSACVSPEDYDKTIGEKIAYSRLLDKIWKLMGYEKQNHAFEVAEGIKLNATDTKAASHLSIV